jgi:DNA-binding transcriptional ArsR family regulator
MLDPVLQAVADSTRRAILQRLAHGQATVGQLAALFPISRPAVSQHLRVLRSADLVRTSGPGRLSAYQLTPAPLLEIEHWARTLAATWATDPLPVDEPPADEPSADQQPSDESPGDRASTTEEPQ